MLKYSLTIDENKISESKTGKRWNIIFVLLIFIIVSKYNIQFNF